jgi:hypothetical protein
MNIRKLRVESLEERTLLAVVAGGLEQAAELIAPTGAQTWIVNTLEDPTEWDTADDVLSLREAISGAATGDVIVFDSTLTGGTITLNGEQLSVNKGITIDASAIGGITIDANEESRVFYVSGGSETNPVEMIALTITGGNISSGYGGGIFNGGFLNIYESTISWNFAFDNYGSADGGGISNNGGTLTIINSTISDNFGTGGGGILNIQNGKATITNSTISGNSLGGGIGNSGSMIINGSTISGNTAHSGAGISNSGNLTITHSKIFGNTAIGEVNVVGGGISNSKWLEISNSTIFGNFADEGGGIGCDSLYTTPTVIIKNSTISGNTANYGGGIRAYGTLTVTNSIISQNYANYDNDVYECIATDSSNNIIGLDPGFVVAPIFKNGKLANIDELDFSLTAGSYAIDHGTNDVVDTETDILGNPRIFAAWKDTATVDIGAYEYQYSVEKGEPETPSTVVTTLLDTLDEFDGLISLREAISYAETGETVTFDKSLAGKTIVLDGADLTISKKLAIDATSIGGITINGNAKSRVFYINEATVDLISLSIKNGRAIWGGGIYNKGSLTITNLIIAGNRGCYWGGGIYSDAKLTVVNSTITNNRMGYSGQRGAGILHWSERLTVTNSIVIQNGNNDDIYNGNGITFGYSTLSSFAKWDKSMDCITYDSSKPLFTNANNGDYSLAKDSQAINVGNNSYVNTETDIAGNPRIVDGIVDLGAYEFFLEAPSTVVNTLLDVVSDKDNLISLREAIAYADEGDTITFDSSLAGGTITLNGKRIEITKGITIDASDIGDITVDGNGKSGVFYLNCGDSDKTVELINLTITGGDSWSSNNGIYCYRTTAVITNCLISGNKGGIYSDYCAMTLTNCTINGNTSNNSGGGIYSNECSMTLTKCTVSGNSGSSGGGIYHSGSLTLTDCTISENSAKSSGGGIYFSNGTLEIINSTIAENSAKNGGGLYASSYNNSNTPTITKSEFSGNNADSYGGGIYLSNGPLTITNSIISENSAGNYGGGIYGSGTLTITSSVVSRNSAESGAGIYNSYGAMTLINSAIFGNSADVCGGGIYRSSSGNLSVTNTTITGNSAESGGGIYANYATLTITNSIVSLNYAVNDGNIYSNEPFSENKSILDIDPGFVVAPVFESGKLVNSDELDLSLRKTSCAIDRGTNELVTVDTDLAENQRIVAAWKELSTVDIGAYEYQESIEDGVFELPSTIVTTTLDVFDVTDGLISLREALFYAESGDTISFDETLTGGVITLDGSQLENKYKVITIDATAIGGVTIDAGNKSRVFYITGGDETSPVELINLTITGGCVDGDNGGGIYAYNCTLKITDSTIVGNTSDKNGGGIYSNGLVTITNAAIFGNSAECGGGVYADSKTVKIINATISGNSAGNYGGGIVSRSALTLTNTIVTQNFASDNNNLAGDYTGSNNIIGLDPDFVVAPVFESGELMNLEELDLSLTEESYAIDHGTNHVVDTETDILGNPRIFAAWKDTATVDIGAYEYQYSVEKGEPETPSTVVTTLLDTLDEFDGLISLREAISYAEMSDIITFDDELAGGTITLNGSEIVIDKGIIIDATSIGGITVDANQESRVFLVSGGTEEQPVELLGIAIVGGAANVEGGIYNYGTLNLIDCSITGNFDSGLSNHYGTLTLTNCEILKNEGSSGWGGGGGIYNENGTLTLVNCIVSENVATDNVYGGGGGIFSILGTVTLTDCTISKNSGIVGGGVHVEVCRLNLSNCVISENYGDYWGGLCIMDGGGSYGSEYVISNCLITQNTAKMGAGIALVYASNVSFVNCTISGNSAEDCGGIYSVTDSGVYSVTTPLEISNSIISQNYGGDYSDKVSYVGSGNILGIDPGFKVAPIFDESGILINSGSVDYSLSATSIAIDAGDNNAVISETDLVGENRIVASRSEQAIVDIGAYEYQFQSDNPFKTITVTTNSDIVDESDDQISLREALLYANDGDTIVFAADLAGQKITLSGGALEITKWITIDATSIGGITVDANKESRVLYVNSESKSLIVELNNLVITGGLTEDGYGGGILNGLYCTLSLDSCTITESEADNGGGICNFGTLTMTNCTVSGNTASSIYSDNGLIYHTGNIYGGGIYNGRGALTMTNCTVARNTANGSYHGDGGGIYNSGGSLTLTNCTVASNIAFSSDGSSSGGGICDLGTSFIYNTIIVQNTASTSDNDVSGRSIYAYNTLSSFTDWTDSNNCLIYDPYLPLFTDVANFDFTLADNSQAIDRGNNSYVTTVTDIAGNIRIDNGIVDIGAYEFQDGRPSITDVALIVDRLRR